VRCQPASDPLTVWTFVQAGEEIASGDLSVTDQQRAAAGRETVAERRRALLEPNHRRAAEQYAAGGLPNGEDVLRVWRPRHRAARWAGDHDSGGPASATLTWRGPRAPAGLPSAQALVG